MSVILRSTIYSLPLYKSTQTMVNYDVFISYSRKDMSVANRLCDALDKLGVSYWIDRNIHGSANFLSEITRYIRNCRVVVFIASPNSAQSEWTQKEILFALKHKKEIIPYRIGNFHFEDNDELDFVFTNVQWIESEAAVVSALKELGCTFGSTPAPEPVPTPQPPEAARKTYKVGDYYNENGKEGVVFEVSADGQHGKIVSMTQSREMLRWSSDEAELKRLIGADSKSDGAYNMAKVKAVANWQEKYPAFKWCANLGEGWYLPSIDELKKFTLNDAVHNAVNRTLTSKGGEKLFSRQLYWSSTEHNHQRSSGEFCAWGVRVDDGGAGSGRKNYNFYVRAVSAF